MLADRRSRFTRPLRSLRPSVDSPGGNTESYREDLAGASCTPPQSRQTRSAVANALRAKLSALHPWKAATSKAYAKLPHEYTLRKQWHDDASFDWIVAHIRAVGDQQRFIGRIT